MPLRRRVRQAGGAVATFSIGKNGSLGGDGASSRSYAPAIVFPGKKTAYELLTTEYGFSKKCSMASMSRGTLSLFRWASTNPEKVESIYVDNGVCNVLSWPASYKVPGNNSTSDGDADSWAGFKKKFGYATDAEALLTKESPIDQLEPLAKAGVPILMVCGSKDTAVPYAENEAIMEERYKKLGGSIQVIIENKGHSHGMKDPTPVLEFIKRNTSNDVGK